MNTNFKKAILAAMSATLLAVNSAQASDWAGATGNWSSNLNPGWNGTGVPNAVGAVANHGVATTSTTTQDVVGGVTVGTISLTNNSNNSWTITNTNGINLNNGGTGASISNTNSNTGTTNFLFLSGGTLTLADSFTISNTGASTNTTGAIQITSVIAGSGDVTFSNVSTALSQVNSIRMVTATNTFTGAVLLQKGTVTTNQTTVFGSVSNAVTLGQSGQGSAAILSTSSTANIANPITVASGSGGTLAIGSTSTAGFTGFSGTTTLNGDLNVTSLSTGSVTTGNTLTLSGAISGNGSLTKIGTGSATLSNGTNSYIGGTVVSTGNLRATASGALGTGSVTIAAGAALGLSTGVTNPNFIDDLASVLLNGSTSRLNLAFTGTETVGALTINGAAFGPGTYGTADNAQLTGTGTLTVVPEPSTYVMLIGAMGMMALVVRRKAAVRA